MNYKIFKITQFSIDRSKLIKNNIRINNNNYLNADLKYF